MVAGRQSQCSYGNRQHLTERARVTRRSRYVAWRRTIEPRGWKRAANLTVEPAAAHIETTRPNTEPMSIGLILRSAGESPSLRSAISRPPKNHGRHAGGMPPLKVKRIWPTSSANPHLSRVRFSRFLLGHRTRRPMPIWAASGEGAPM